MGTSGRRAGELCERRSVDGELIEVLPAPALAVQLDLAPHPEGGWYRRTWTSPVVVATDGGPRPAATVIVFLLPRGERSAWHRVTSTEVWVWNGGGQVSLQLGGFGEQPEAGEVLVLDDAARGGLPQGEVPAGMWQRTLVAAHDAQATCVVSPGFDFADFTLADETDDGAHDGAGR